METVIKSESAQEYQLGKVISTTAGSANNPYTIQPTKSLDVVQWAKENREALNNLLVQQGALLLRGFEINGPEKFNALFSIICGDAMEYKNRTSPRDQVYNNVYTSTSHPSDQTIHMHTENSYSNAYNRIISFYCLVAPTIGGETPIADERKLLESLRQSTVDKFREKGVRYVRNTVPGIGLDWRTIYQTDDRDEVSKKIRELGYDFSWVDEDHLRVAWNLPAFQRHPITKEDMWFNHMYFGHKNLYDPAILEFFPEEDLPFLTCYGDGSPIEDDVLEEFKNFYLENCIVFKWQKDDFLLLDNMMYSHGRKPFEGDRTILTAMGKPQKMTQIPS